MKNQDRINQIRYRLRAIRKAKGKLTPINELQHPEVQKRYAKHAALVSEEIKLVQELEKLEREN